MKYSYIILFLLVSGIIAFITIFSLKKSKTLKGLPKNYLLEQKRTLEEVGLPVVKLGETIPRIIHRTHENTEILENLYQDPNISSPRYVILPLPLPQVE